MLSGSLRQLSLITLFSLIENCSSEVKKKTWIFVIEFERALESHLSSMSGKCISGASNYSHWMWIQYILTYFFSSAVISQCHETCHFFWRHRDFVMNAKYEQSKHSPVDWMRERMENNVCTALSAITIGHLLLRAKQNTSKERKNAWMTLNNIVMVVVRFIFFLRPTSMYFACDRSVVTINIFYASLGEWMQRLPLLRGRMNNRPLV